MICCHTFSCLDSDSEQVECVGACTSRAALKPIVQPPPAPLRASPIVLERLRCVLRHVLRPYPQPLLALAHVHRL